MKKYTFHLNMNEEQILACLFNCYFHVKTSPEDLQNDPGVQASKNIFNAMMPVMEFNGHSGSALVEQFDAQTKQVLETLRTEHNIIGNEFPNELTNEENKTT